MKVIDRQTVELTPVEYTAWDEFHELLDEGFNINEAIAQLTARESLAVEFLDWLAGKS